MPLRTEELMLNMGPQHPSTHGVLRLVVTLDGENIVDIQPDIGYLHSSVEKMMEYRTYLQNVALTDRGMDYLTAMANEEVYLLAIEKIGAHHRAAPRRSICARSCSSSSDSASHLVWLGTWGIDLGATTVFLYCFRERERILDLFEQVTGGRLHHVYFRPGGVYEDLPAGWTERALAFCDEFPTHLQEYQRPADRQPDLSGAHPGRRRAAARRPR